MIDLVLCVFLLAIAILLTFILLLFVIVELQTLYQTIEEVERCINGNNKTYNKKIKD